MKKMLSLEQILALEDAIRDSLKRSFIQSGVPVPPEFYDAANRIMAKIINAAQKTLGKKETKVKKHGRK